MQNLSKDDLKKFLRDSHPKRLDNVYLQYDGNSIDPLADDICETLKVTKNEIFLEKMRFNEISLKSIMSSAAKANRLVLKDCHLGISKSFKGGSADYQLSTVNMYNTFKNDSKTFEYFISGMRKTGLENTKFELQLSEKDFGKKVKSKGKGKKGKINDQEYKLRVEENVLNELKEVLQGLSFTYEARDVGEYHYEGQTVGKDIAGHGIYTHKKDKKVIREHYSKDFVHQYEVSTKSDGTTFMGYVRDGAKHGLGIESNKKNKDKDDDEVFCLYVHDKLVHEFNDKDAREINKKNYKNIEYFKDNKKSLKHVKDGQTFAKPEDFDFMMDEVRARIKHMKDERLEKLKYLYYEEPYFHTKQGKDLEAKHKKIATKKVKEEMTDELNGPGSEDTDDDDKSGPEEVVRKNKYRNCKVVMSKSSSLEPAK